MIDVTKIFSRLPVEVATWLRVAHSGLRVLWVGALFSRVKLGLKRSWFSVLRADEFERRRKVQEALNVCASRVPAVR